MLKESLARLIKLNLASRVALLIFKRSYKLSFKADNH
jgi:hypothetical protein